MSEEITTFPSSYVISPGGKKLEHLPPELLVSALAGGLLPPQVEAAALTIIDQIQQLERGLPIPDFFKPQKPLSRSVLVILQYYGIRNENLAEFVKLLSALGYAGKFFSLAEPENDTGLKNYLLDNGILWDTVLYYHDLNGWDAIRFTEGFIIGLGASYASILEVLKDLFEFTVEAFQEPKKAHDKIAELFDRLRQLTGETLFKLGADEWHKLNYEFSEALYSLDFFQAGFILGKLAGDLWQLLKGVAALRKLPGMTIDLARKFVPLFIAGARQSAQALKILAELILNIDTKILIDAPAVGLRALGNLVENLPFLLEKLKDGVLIVMDELGQMIIVVPGEGAEFAGVGQIEPGLYIGRTIEGTSTIFAKVRTGTDKAINYVENTLKRVSKSVKKVELSPGFLAQIEKVEKEAVAFVNQWRDTLQEILRENKIPLKPGKIGTWLHGHMEVAFEALAKVMKNSFDAIAEINIRNLAKRLNSSDEFIKRADISLYEFVRTRPKLLNSLSLQSESDLLKFLKKLGYTDPTKTLIGDLVCDGVLFNEETGRLISIDWTSGLGRYRFANEYKKLLEAGKDLSEVEQVQLAKQFISHSLREYVIREAILEFVFEGWETKVLEIPYEPFKLVK